MGDEHRGGLLDVVAAGMEERVEGELGTAGEVVALGTPGYLLSRNGGGGRNVFLFPRKKAFSFHFSPINPNTHRGLFIEGSQEAVKAVFAHQ